MKNLNRILILFLLVVFVQAGSLSAQNWKDAANKAKNSVKDKKDKKDKKKDKEEGKTEEKTKTEDKEDVKEKEKSNKLEKLTFDASTIFVEYEGLFSEMNLDPETGNLKIKKITIKNLPKANYGTVDNKHKLTAVLKLNNKKIHEFIYEGISEYTVAEWTNGNCNSDYTITQAGKYTLEFQIDGQLADKIDFDIIQSVNKNNKMGWFLNSPLESLGLISSKGYVAPVATDEFVFKFYEAILDIEGAFVDATPISIRLMKENKDANDTYIGGYLKEKLRHNKKWKLTDNIFFTKAGERYKYVTFGDVLSNDGNYYIDLFYNGNVFKYNFEVKGGKLNSSLIERSKTGTCWLQREYVGVPKYENFKPTANISGKADNIRVTVKGLKEGDPSRGYAENKPATFVDGQSISMTNYLKDDVRKKYMYRLTEYIVTLKKGDEILAQEITLGIYNDSPNGDFKSIIRNPETAMFAVNKSTDTHVFMDALSKLPAGNHKLKFVYEMASGKDNDFIGLRTITYKSHGKNAKFTEWAEDTKMYLEMSNSQLGEVAFLRAPTDEWVYFVNNCGTTVWLRVDEYKEYYLYPGDKAKFNRTGFLEQWNFGTWKWNDVPEFDVYKTVFILDANEISMLYLKQVPPEAIEKLKEIQDIEFTSQDAYVKKVKELIGEETFKKHENLLILSASIDYVRICK